MKNSGKAIFLFLFFSLILRSDLLAQVASLPASLSLKTVDNVKVPVQNNIPLPTFEKQKNIRQIIDLASQWKKQRFSADDNISLGRRDSVGYAALTSEAAGRYLASFDDSAWPNKNIPGVENEMYAYPTVPEYYQDGIWYRKTFQIDSADADKFIKLNFLAVNYVADVWLNDVYLGYHEGGYTPFAFDVSSAINYHGDNVLVVRVDNPIWGMRNDIVPYTQCDWFNYAGIIHDVYLEVSDQVSVVRAMVVPKEVNGSIQNAVVLYNSGSADQNLDVNVEIFDADINDNNIRSEYPVDLLGNSAAVSGTTDTSLTINAGSIRVWKSNLVVNNPRLWTPKTPNLYILKVSVKQNGTVIDEYYTQFGIRTIKALVDKVYLNGNPVFFPGIARHEDHPLYGRSIPVDTIFSDLQKVKDLKALMLRTAHYPNHVYTYEIADRLGIAVVEEIPVWWFDTQMAWIIQNSARHIHEQMFREMVFKDFNRPSVLLWSTTNECLDVDNRKVFIARVKQDKYFNYEDGRLITQSAAADRPGADDPSQAACDVAGWTMYFGIFHGGTYYDGTRVFVGEANLTYPEKPILDTEYGYWSGERHTENGQLIQKTVFDSTFAAFTYRASVIKRDGTYRDGGYLMGVTWWCIFDWYSAQHPNGFQSMGVYLMNRDTIKTVGASIINGYTPFYNIGGTISGVENDQNTGIIENYSLEQNYPNPFNPSTLIRYSIPKDEYVSVKIFNILGKEVADIVHENKSAGKYEIRFDADNYHLSSGVYFYRIDAGNFRTAKKLIYLK